MPRAPKPLFCEIPPPDNFIPEASKIWTTTPLYISRAAHQGGRRQSTEVELYDLSLDPFETTNLAENYPRYAGIIKEIRAWAEAEIGRPPLAVVGQWNMAYENMLTTAYKHQKHHNFVQYSRD